MTLTNKATAGAVRALTWVLAVAWWPLTQLSLTLAMRTVGALVVAIEVTEVIEGMGEATSAAADERHVEGTTGDASLDMRVLADPTPDVWRAIGEAATQWAIGAGVNNGVAAIAGQ